MRVLGLLLAILMTWLVGVTPVAGQGIPAVSPPPGKHALILVSAYLGAAATDQYVSGLITGLKKGGLKSSDIHVEHLDLVRHTGSDNRRAMAALLMQRYASDEIELVFCIQQPALDFLLNEMKGLAPRATVLSWTAQMPASAKSDPRQFVFQSTRFDYRGTLERALELFPRTERVIVIQGSSEVERSRAENIRTDLAPWRDKLQIEDTQALSIDEIDARLASAPKNSVILGVGITRDAKGQIFVPPETVARFLKVAQAPFFVLVDLTIGTGTIGGVVTRLGDSAAQFALIGTDLLRGGLRLTEHATVVPDTPVSMFDWAQIRRWGGDVSRLSGKPLFVNRTPTFWDQYRSYGIGIAVFVVAQTLLIAFLITSNRSRKKAEHALQKSEARNRAITQSAHDAIVTADGAGMIVGWNHGAQITFGYAESEVMNRSLTLLMPERYRDQHLAGMKRIGSGGEPRVIGKTVEMHGLHKDASEFSIELSLAKWESSEGWFVSAVMRDITERKQAELQIQSLAFSDPLTGLPNRRMLMDRLEQALVGAVRHGHQDALLFIDLDNFKTLNDTLGHDKGDALLRQIATRLTACVREGDTVARLGGDEFVVLLQDLSSDGQEAAAQAQVVAAKILDALGQTYDLDGYGHRSSASIGVTLFGGRQRETIEEPLKRAELAMYQAKTAGHHTLRFFEAEMQATVIARARLEAELHQAVAGGQFVLHYQPQSGGDARLSGAEALLRWRHPERGLVLPGEFIPVAESSGLILPLGRWVLETACKQLAAWADRRETVDLTMAVNVSVRQFKEVDFVQELLAILEATGANAQRLKIELTESVLVENAQDIVIKMNDLKARGIGFSLDDFGTGYSSLSYLKRLPLDQLKIDRSFVRDILTDPDDAAIARMVVALAESMGLELMAEGVETEAQRAFLAGLGCHNYQGYLFSRPLPIEEFEAFV